MMQQQTAATSNLQIKLITDARKLLEKVRSQQGISTDSSFDSSFLFDSLHDSKGVEKKVGTNDDGDEKLTENQNPSIAELEEHSKSSLSSILSASKSVQKQETEPRQQSSIDGEPPTQELDGDSKISFEAEPEAEPEAENPSNLKTEDEIVQNNQDDNRSVVELNEENMKLRRENHELHEEMSEFEYKLYCLEHSLGIIEDVERSTQSVKDDDEMIQRKGSGEVLRPNPLLPEDNSDDANDDSQLTPVTEIVADAILAGSGLKQKVDRNASLPGRQAPPSTPLSSSQEHELHILRQNNKKMVTAIKALAQATISQTRKHYLYKKRHHMTKKMVVEESEKTNQLMLERNQIANEFYETRANFLREKDIREELSNELQLLARKNSDLRKDKRKDQEMRQRILSRVESRDDDISVLSRLSQSSCFPILQTITEGDPSQAQAKAQATARSRKDKNLEKLIFKLISQLKKRDEKIEKLEKKLKITMKYLEGALELEVARQDADLASQKG